MLAMLKRMSWFRKNKGLRAVNLALSLDCCADCIFCPSSPRARDMKQRMMTLNSVDKILEEIISPEFRKKHKIEIMSISQNGEAFLNKELIDILRLIKRKAPYIKVCIFTNFSRATKEYLEIILEEGLIHEFNCNIDGYNKSNYFSVKKLDLDSIKNNMLMFIELRKKLKLTLPLTIWVLTLHNYIHAIHKNFGFYPGKLKDLNLINEADDFNLIKEEYAKIIDPTQDKIMKSDPVAWAERDKVDLNGFDYNKFSCSNLRRVKEEAFIAPDGTWYACCLDAQCELNLGNVLSESIDKVYNNKIRMNLIKLLEQKRFAEIGGPCKTVMCCQVFKEDMR